MILTTAISPLRWRQWLLPLFGVVLLWPALFNGAPFLFPDTSAYIRAADAVALRLGGQPTAWTNQDVRQIVSRAEQRPVTAPKGAVAEDEPKPVLLGRSIYYGMIAYIGAAFGTLWLVILLQALLVGGMVLGAVRHFVDPADRKRFRTAFGVVILALATTPLPFFVSMIMPDVFTGVAIVAGAALLVGWSREHVAGRIGWGLLAAGTALTHSSHVLVLFGLAAVALIASVRRSRFSRAAILATGVAACSGLVGEWMFAASVRSATGFAPIRPPFVSARLIEDGPGFSYLLDRCGAADLLLCRYRDRLPLPSDEFLWRSDERGVFKSVSHREQRILAEEQGRFILSVVQDRPLEVIASTSAAIGRQAMKWGLPEFDQSLPEAQDFVSTMPPEVRERFERSGSARGTVPTAGITIASMIWTVLAAAATLATWRGAAGPELRYAALLASGWLINIAVCGALSTPHERYSMRAIWVFSLIALFMLFAAFRRRRHPAGSASVPAPGPERGIDLEEKPVLIDSCEGDPGRGTHPDLVLAYRPAS